MIFFLYLGLLFSVFGFCCAAERIADWILSPRAVSVAVEIRTKAEADCLEPLLHEASAAFFGKTAVNPIVLISSELMQGEIGEMGELYESYSALLELYGAECYIVDP